MGKNPVIANTGVM